MARVACRVVGLALLVLFTVACGGTSTSTPSKPVASTLKAQAGPICTAAFNAPAPEPDTHAHVAECLAWFDPREEDEEITSQRDIPAEIAHELELETSTQLRAPGASGATSTPRTSVAPSAPRVSVPPSVPRASVAPPAPAPVAAAQSRGRRPQPARRARSALPGWAPWLTSPRE